MRPGNGRPVSAAPPQVGGAQLPPPIVTVPTPSASPLASPSSRPFPSVTIPSSFGTAPSAPMTSPIPGMGPLPRAPGPARIVSMPPAPSTNALGASGPPQRPIPVPGPPQANKLGASADLSQNPPYSSSNPLASSAPAIPETGSNGVPLRPPPQVRSVPPRMSVPNVMAAPSPSSSSSSASPSPHFGGEEVVNKRATVAARPSVPRASTISSASPSRPLSLRKSKSITNPSFVMQQANRGENPDAFKFIYQTLLRQILTDGVQLESLRTEEILSTVRTSVYKRRDTTRLLIEKKDKLFLTDLVRLIENFLEEQEEARALIKCQSAIRRWKVLKQFQGLSKEQLDEQNDRNAIYLEITRTEKMYCDQLKLLIDKVVIPLRQLEILPPYHIADIFSNIESVLESHKPLIGKLTEASNNWPFVRGIGKIFLDINNLLKNYGVYVGNFKNSINEIDRLRQEYPKFQAFLDDVNGRFDLDVPTMLLLPVNKISQYELLLSSLGDQCKFDEVEREETLKAYSVLHQSSKVIQINLVQSGELAKILDIQRRLKSDRPMSLAQQGRRFVNMTTCKKNTLILFNDVLVIAKSAKVHRVRKDLNDDKMKVEEQVEIGRLNVVDSGDVNIELQTPTKTHKVSMKSIDDKKDFLGALNILAEEKNRRKVFGVPIIDTVIREERKNGVPYIVEKIIEYLRSRPNDLLQSGIFRVAGKKTEIDELKDIFDKGGENALNLDLSKYSTFSICDTLKLYFRMLPEPVLGLTLYNPFVELMRDETLNEAVQVERARNLIISWTPPFALKVLRYLLKFLQLVASMSHENMMTTSNLSIVFGPTLLWSEVNTLESAMDMPWVNSCVRLLIDHSIETLGEN